MRFLIISHTPHEVYEGKYYAYEPYIREMNIWLKHVENVEVVAPLVVKTLTKVKSNYNDDHLVFTKVPQINFTTFFGTLKSLIYIPYILIVIIQACRRADHIHLRCPGNIGLLGCIGQLFFPSKIKTAKYAGNWDPKSKQPISYRLQKWLLSNSDLTKNIRVLVYGNWANESANIKPFFTASFNKSEITPIQKRNYEDDLKFIFIGSLVEGKRPLFAIQMVERLTNNGLKVSLDIFGEGPLKFNLKDYIKEHGLETSIKLWGSRDKEVIKAHLQMAHFLILPSRSEGWPKAVAEAMFFGVVPIATKISCVPSMLDNGERGILIEPNVTLAVEVFLSNLKDKKRLELLARSAAEWSHRYTLDKFESEIVNMITH